MTALLRHQTDVGSAADQRGDHATADRLLDAEVLFSGGDGSVQRDPKRDKTDALSALLKRQTQAFRDAGERGDRAAMLRYLDDDVLFIDEDGVVSNKRTFRAGAPAPVDGAVSTVVVKDWILHHAGDVAVSSFTDDQVVRYAGTAVNYRFLSVETWIEHGRSWKLIGSQTIPLYRDPAVMTAPSDTLNDYVGVYTAGPGSAVTITRDGDGLRSANSTGAVARLEPEARDVFFRPGVPPGYDPPRSVFQRDANGNITGYVTSGIVLTKAGPAATSSASSSPPPLG
ncbi:MAG: DUF4440 domain-containing protein, partial [Candidatus Eremiobacteraeota bacterium]|nr:DUF4440 domain-containing protein [Candidatus Eremiobacteraeota bacterium]